MGVAVVTGAGRGIGREVARRLVARGYEVLVTDLTEAHAQETARELGSRAWPAALDVRDPAEHRAAAATAAERGRLEVWVNNAGVLRIDKTWEHPDDDVRLLVEVNVLGMMWGTRAAIEAMRGTGGGHIVNVASMSAHGAVPGLAVYAATKHAALGFTTSTQGDLDEAGLPIRMHAICPGTVRTPMVDEQQDEADAAVLFSGSMLEPEQVADMAVGAVDGRRIVHSMPASTAAISRALAPFPRANLQALKLLRRAGDRRRGGYLPSRRRG